MKSIRLPSLNAERPNTAIAFTLACFLPFLMHFFYIIPAYDDFCFSAGALDHGYFDNIWRIYNQWTGRLASIALASLPLYVATKIAINFVYVYQIFSISLFILVCMILYVIFKLNHPSLSGSQNALLTLLTLATIVFVAVSPRDLFFWLSAAFPYTLSGVIYIYLVSIFSNTSFSEKKYSRKYMLLIWFLCFSTATFNEFTGLSLFLISTIALFIIRIREKSISGRFRDLFLCSVCSLSGSMLVLLAPGNQVRMENFEQPGVFVALLKGLLFFHDYVSFYFVNLVTVIYCLILFSFFALWNKKESNHGALSIGNGVFHIVAWVILAVLAFVAGAYGMGHTLPGRAQNQLQLVGIVAIGIFIGSSVVGRSFAGLEHTKAILWKRSKSIVPLSLILLVLFLGNPILIRAAANLYGDTKAVFEEHIDRFDQITVGSDDILLPAITAWSELNSTPELRGSSDPDHGINRCMAQFFGKRSILLKD